MVIEVPASRNLSVAEEKCNSIAITIYDAEQVEPFTFDFNPSHLAIKCIPFQFQ